MEASRRKPSLTTTVMALGFAGFALLVVSRRIDMAVLRRRPVRRSRCATIQYSSSSSVPSVAVSTRGVARPRCLRKPCRCRCASYVCVRPSRWFGSVRETSATSSVGVRHDSNRCRGLSRSAISVAIHPDAALTYLWGPGRNPAAAGSPGAGWIAGYGPARGLKGTFRRGGGADFGCVEAMNWGLLRFRHELNCTVDPRYGEHLESN